MAELEMSMEDQWSDCGTLERYLATQLSRGRIGLILGAGISKFLGLPKWEALLDRMYNLKGHKRPSAPDLKRLAEAYRTTYYRDNYEGYKLAVKEALYQGVEVDFKKIRENATMAALGAMVIASLRGRASSVVTFNFDDLLELYLEYHGFVVTSVSVAESWAQLADVEVLHPHGLLPALSLKEMSKDIVLDQKSYSDVVGRNDWPWRQRLLSVFRSRTCVLIGLSGEDDHLDSLLLECYKSHAIRGDATRYWGVRLSLSGEETMDSAMRERGIFPHHVSDFDNGLPDFLFRVCQKAAELRTT